MSSSPSPTTTAPRSVRRPPAGPTHWATVTRLGIGGPSDPEPVPVAAVQGTLALDLEGWAETPDAPDLRVVQGGRTGAPDVKAWSARFAQAVVEVLGGDRPIAQLLRWTSNRVYCDLDRRVRFLGRTSVSAARSRTIRPQVRSVHVFQPTPETAEVSVHVRHGARSRALAARLELHRGRWQCTALQLG